MYSTSVTPERCVREAFGEQYDTWLPSLMQYGPSLSSSTRCL